MQIRILEKNQTSLINLAHVKCYLRIDHEEDDALIQTLIERATDLVQEEINKSLLTRSIQVSHTNNRFILPFGPVQHITRVVYNRKILNDTAYKMFGAGAKTGIEVPFQWKKSDITVEYTAGFGNAVEDVPQSLHQSVLNTVVRLYENRIIVQGMDGFMRDIPGIQKNRNLSLV